MPMSDRYRFTLTEDSVFEYVIALLKETAAAGEVVVDIGCGYGAIAEVVRELGMTYIGLDVDPSGLSNLAERQFRNRNHRPG